MRKIVIIAAVTGLSAIAIAAPTGAEARFGAGAIANAVADVSPAEPAQYYGRRHYRRHYARGYYAPRYYAPRYYAPRYYAPNYYSYSYKNSRDALATCAYC